MSFELHPLPYNYDALEPFVDIQTMYVHYNKHHETYRQQLNTYIKENDPALDQLPITQVLNQAKVPKLRNNAGGHYNHSLFWTWMTPPGNSHDQPTGPLMERIQEDFGSFDAMCKEFTTAAGTHFGSGWAWLGVKRNGKLGITATINQDNPLMPHASEPMIPIFGLDVWEHAYYLKYQNRRPEYIQSFWKLANWDQVVEYYESYASKGLPIPISSEPTKP